MKYIKLILAFLCIFFSFLSGNVYSQLTYVNCSSTCPGQLVGQVTFANTSGATTGSWDLNSIGYGGLVDQSFAITNPASYTYTAGNFPNTPTGGGNYTIVNNPSSITGPSGAALQNVNTGGIFLFSPNDNANAFAKYTISGLQQQGKYCVRIKMRNVTATKDGCNPALYAIARFESLAGQNISGGGVSGGTATVLSTNPACTLPGPSGWDGNNQSYGIEHDQDYAYYETNFQIGQNPNNTNDDGFTIYFQAQSWQPGDVWGIQEIDVYGCVTQQLLSSNGTSVCEETPTTLTTQGIGSTTDTYSWKSSTDGGATFTPITSSTSDTLSVNPPVATLYSATCARTSLSVTATITPVNCCGPTGLFTIPKVCDPITVDGVDNEPVWYTAPWQTVTQPFTLSGNQDCIVASPTCSGVQANPAGEWRCVHTATDIYFDVRVYEANPQNAAQVYYQDAVEIYIANNTNTPLQFGYEYVNGVPGFYNSNGATNGSAEIVKNATYWDLEVRIPIAANNIDLSPGYLKMELGINQAKPGCSNCRAAQLFTWIAANHYSSTAQYHTAPLSDCAGVKASNNTVCNGGSSVLTTQLSTINAGLNYSWEQSLDGVNWTPVTGTTNTITVTPAVQTLYRAIYDNVNSCPDTVKIGTISLTVTDPAPVCSPNSVDLTNAAITAGSQAGLTYSYFTDLLATTPLVNPTKVTTANTYYIKGQSTSCFGVEPVVVKFNPAPTISGVNTVCVSGTTQLTGSATAAAVNPWVSANTGVATVDNTGKVTGVSAGTSLITYENNNTCTDTMTVTVNSPITPTFTAVAGICSGGTLNALPVTSNNGVTGTWSPALNNTTTTTYTFTPSAGQCATTTTMNIVVNSGTVTPTFTQVPAVCSGGTLNALPTTSNNGITGTWLPALNNTATTTYTFTPTSGQCAITTTMSITVNSPVTPTFTPVNSPICSASTINALPTTSTNGITGTWSPALNNTATTTYTFTPDVGQCATTTTLTITVSSSITPTFTQVAAVCSGAILNALPTTSTNGMTGSWSPALNNTATTTYTFTPDPGQCGVTTTMTITINQIPSAPTSPDTSRCGIGPVTLIATPSGASTDILTWYSDAGLTTQVASGTSFTTPNITSATDYYVTETNSSDCISTPATVTVTIIPQPSAQFTPLAPVCENAAPFVLSGGSEANNLPGRGFYSGNGVEKDSITFSPQLAGPGLDSPIVFTYVSANGCSDTAQQSINVYPVPSVSYGDKQSVLQGDSLALTPIPSSIVGTGLTYLWTPSLYLSSDTSSTPLCKPVDDITYNILVTSPGHCSSTATLLVQVLTDFDVPNTFTPNNDGINDKWEIKPLAKFPIQWVQVFDRYGQLLFESHGYTQPWDGTYNGKALPAGTYYYIIEVNGLLSPKTGYVTILR